MSGNSSSIDGDQITNETPSIDSDGGNDSSGGLVPSPSKGQIALIVGLAVVVAVLAWRFKSDSDDGEDELEAALKDDLAGDVEVTDEDEDSVEIEVPVDPSDELEKDAAVLDALKRSGKMQGSEDE